MHVGAKHSVRRCSASISIRAEQPARYECISLAPRWQHSADALLSSGAASLFRGAMAAASANSWSVDTHTGGGKRGEWGPGLAFPRQFAVAGGCAFAAPAHSLWPLKHGGKGICVESRTTQYGHTCKQRVGSHIGGPVCVLLAALRGASARGSLSCSCRVFQGKT